jgi:small subunit ribosomal protein S21
MNLLLCQVFFYLKNSLTLPPFLNTVFNAAFQQTPLTKKVKLVYMLIIDVKNGESIDQALRRYKRKFQRTQIIKELRRRKEFTKPSVERRNQLLKAIYKQRKQRQEEL